MIHLQGRDLSPFVRYTLARARARQGGVIVAATADDALSLLRARVRAAIAERLNRPVLLADAPTAQGGRDGPRACKF